MTPMFLKNTHEKHLQSCGWVAKISGSYQAKSLLLTLPNTDMYIWLRMNLTHNHITKRPLNINAYVMTSKIYSMKIVKVKKKI